MKRIDRFDQVQIITTKNVHYLSAPPGRSLEPGGVWSVAAILNGSELLLTKNSVTIRIPATDVLKVGEFKLDHLLNQLGKLSDGKADE